MLETKGVDYIHSNEQWYRQTSGVNAFRRGQTAVSRLFNIKEVLLYHVSVCRNHIPGLQFGGHTLFCCGEKRQQLLISGWMLLWISFGGLPFIFFCHIWVGTIRIKKLGEKAHNWFTKFFLLVQLTHFGKVIWMNAPSTTTSLTKVTSMTCMTKVAMSIPFMNIPPVEEGSAKHSSLLLAQQYHYPNRSCNSIMYCTVVEWHETRGSLLGINGDSIGMMTLIGGVNQDTFIWLSFIMTLYYSLFCNFFGQTAVLPCKQNCNLKVCTLSS